PEALPAKLREPRAGRGIGHGIRHPEREAGGAVEEALEKRAGGAILALRRRAARRGDQLAERSVAAPIRREQHELDAGQLELGADDELQRQRLRRCVRAHDARDGALVGQREPRVTQARGALDELVRVRGAAQKREVADAVQLRVPAPRPPRPARHRAPPRWWEQPPRRDSTVGAAVQPRSSQPPLRGKRLRGLMREEPRSSAPRLLFGLADRGSTAAPTGRSESAEETMEV